MPHTDGGMVTVLAIQFVPPPRRSLAAWAIVHRCNTKGLLRVPRAGGVLLVQEEGHSGHQGTHLGKQHQCLGRLCGAECSPHAPSTTCTSIMVHRGEWRCVVAASPHAQVTAGRQHVGTTALMHLVGEEDDGVPCFIA